MPPPRQTYIVRDSGGLCRTVIAHSLRGAVKIWLSKNPKYLGDIEVKVRGGAASWQSFRISSR